jgi:uncharacterized protein
VNVSKTASNPYINKKTWAALVPYVTIGTGVFVFSNVWAAVLGYHLVMAIVLFFAGRQISFSQIRKSGNYKILIVTCIMGAAGGLLLYLLWPLLAVSAEVNLFLRNIGFNAAMWPYFIVYFVLVNPWLEEFYWRGFLGSDAKWMTPNDLLFSGYHVMLMAGKVGAMWLIILFIVLSLAAWLWRQADRWNKGISASVISHFAADTTIILVIYYFTISSL